MHNQLRDFDDSTRSALGIYVYGLIDPRDDRVFYVGKGGGSKADKLEGSSNLRIFEHFYEVEKALRAGRALSAKQATIQAVWDKGMNVGCHIFRRRLQSPDEAFDVEAGIIAALRESKNGMPDNDNNGMHLKSRGYLSLQDALDLGAPPVSPGVPITVLLLNIGTSLAKRADRTAEDYYECTRSEWVLGEGFRQSCEVAIGIQNEISRAAFKNLTWELTRTATKPNKRGGTATTNYFSFEGTPVEDGHELLGRNWGRVLSEVPWRKRGGALVVRFDGQAKFQIIRGASETRRGVLHPCIP
jgi:hypothetical protein